MNGQIVPAKQATVSVNDLGLLRGYGIFDFFLFEQYYPYFFDDYINRFFQSADIVGLEIPYKKPVLKEQVLELIRQNEASEGGIRLLLTGGESVDGITLGAPQLCILQYPRPGYPSTAYSEGVRLITHNYQRHLAKAKSTDYLMAMYLRKPMQEAGAIDILYHQNGLISEAARSNVIFIDQEDRMIIPEAKTLAGVTLKNLRQASELFYEQHVRPVYLEELTAFKEAFLCSTIKGVMPIVQIDQQQIGNGQAGQHKGKLSDLFLEYRRQQHRETISLLT